MKIAPIDLGCPKNTVDLEKVVGLLVRPELRIVGDPREADVVIINTCAFIRPAVEEALETIIETARLKKQGIPRVVVTGCLPQRFGRELAGLLPEAELVVTARDPARIAARIRRFLGLRATRHEATRWSLTPPHYAYLKIAGGCDNRCAYCTIPLIKGRYRSKPAEAIMAEARELVRRGAQELIVVAQDTTLYGAERGSPSALPELLRALGQVDGPRWIRLMYTHPAHVDEAVIATIAGEERICKYIDLPVQHGSDRILAAMGRKTTRAQLEQLVHHLRQQIPSLAIRSTVMVGFPGETEEDFEMLLDFLETVRFDHLGVFTYWPEEETRAAAMAGQVPEEEKNARQAQVLDLQSRISSARTASLQGRTVQVLVDEVDKTLGISWGRTEWDAPEVDSRVRIDDILELGHFAAVRITGSDGFDLYATPASRSSTSAAAGEGAELNVPREVSRA
ncbi:MAG: 30S ribosomal protein S12 methylthiotransferase RimO [bacterium]|jgi:ribosomal protein S12 methylthiotransferase|nr:30S ribosomal protein S12 methylthiotransferase RimO [candidate division KSB1 bacterium]MDH7559594.1 30S ribosomal protein S12 methylthiotransferase RimO [bacterium]